MNYDNNKPPGVTLESLNSRPKTEQMRIVRDIVRVVDSAIVHAHSLNINHTQYELDIVYDIPGLSKEDARLFVYSEVIDIYTKKGFTDIKLFQEATKTILQLNWVNSLPDDERIRRKQIVKKVLVSPNASVHNTRSTYGSRNVQSARKSTSDSLRSQNPTHRFEELPKFN
jgi:hypothetical protein